MDKANLIFDEIIKIGHITFKLYDIKEKERQLKSVLEKRCGNCDHWMKSSCIPEKKLGQFKSCNSFACKDFAIDIMSASLATQFKQDLEHLIGEYHEKLPVIQVTDRHD